jgi:hypothetical protein
MGARRAGVLVLTSLALGLAACGSNDGNGDDDTAEAIEQDRQAKSEARQLVTEMEVCFVEEQGYTDCSPPSADEDVSLRTARDAFTIRIPSESGNVFEIGRTPESAELVRTCETAGEAGCPDSGTW